MKKQKTLGIVFAMILVLIISAMAALAFFGIFSEKPEEGETILIQEEKFKNKNLEWQVKETEGDKILTLSTEQGEIAIKLFDCAATEKFIELNNSGAFDSAEFTVIAEGFIQTGVYGESFAAEKTDLAVINGAFGFVMDEKNSAPSLIIITADELSGMSSALLGKNGFDEERASLYKNFGGFPEYENAVNIFGMVIDSDALSKIAKAENSGYTGGFSASEPIAINSITIE